MANEEHLTLLKQGVDAWNEWWDELWWRWENDNENPDVDPDSPAADLSGVDFSEENLVGVHLGGANLAGANLSEAYLSDAYLSEANLVGANLSGTSLSGTSLSKANLSGANLSGAHLYGADLSKANLNRTNLNTANLTEVNLTEADLTDADITGCRIYGISAWGLKNVDKAKQQNLVITPPDEPDITVDNIEVAQFIYLLLHNQKIRDIIDTITSKAVLILGRFTPERKQVLDALREELRNRGYLPILFDFEGPTSRNTDETITLLARMARFVIADISDAKSVLQELREIVPNLPSLPVQPIIVATQEEPGMFDFYRPFPWFLKAHRYGNQKQLIANLGKQVIAPAERKVKKLRGSG
jgi:hypothetical protein